MKFLATIVCFIVTLTIGFVSCDYYGTGFPAGGYGPELIRYKKVPFPYRSGRNTGYGGQGAYLGGDYPLGGGYPLNDGY